MNLLRRVRRGELARKVREVRKGQLAGERLRADAQKHHVRFNQVVYCQARGFDTRLGFRVARQLAQDLADLLLHFAQRCFGLEC